LNGRGFGREGWGHGKIELTLRLYFHDINLVVLFGACYFAPVGTTTTSSQIPKLRFHDPLRNLPEHPAGRSRESALTYRFGQAYIAQVLSGHHRTKKNALAAAREIPVNGYGIADFVVVSWNPSRLSHPRTSIDPELFVKRINPTLRAFEVKLTNWRRALMQANRYRFFAHVPIVVLPESKCHVALEHLDTFRLVRVGLWSFDPKTNRIARHFTPRSMSPLDARHQLRVLRLIARASKTLPIS
jgi:hypothetical protein